MRKGRSSRAGAAAMGGLCALAIGGCYLSHERSDSTACTPPERVGSCAEWQSAGPSVVLASAPAAGISLRAASAVATECGVVAAWTSTDGRHGPPYAFAFQTRRVGWDARPNGAAHDHPALAAGASSFGVIELAANGDALAALAVTEEGGTRFAALGPEGADAAPPVTIEGAWSFALAAAGAGFAFFQTSDTGATPGTLVAVDANGGAARTFPLAMTPGRSLWSRATFEDGSFLVYSFHEDFSTAVYSGWLQHFDARGEALAPEVEVSVNAVPVLVAPIFGGALSLWTTAQSGGLPLQYRRVDRDGRPTADVADLPAAGALYGATLVSTPDGGALATWLEHHEEAPQWLYRAQAFASDGTESGAPTLLSTEPYGNPGRVVIDGSGRRGLVVFDGIDESPRALPIRCAR